MEWNNLFYLGFGAIVGSFLGTVIVRIPKEESVATPRSHCRHCGKTLLWYDLIPILSYLFLLGRCRFCKKSISIEYFIVEVITAIMAMRNFQEFGFRPQGFSYFIFISSLIVITFIDIHHRIIPDIISIGGTIFGFLLSFYFLNISYWESLMGLLIGGGLLYAIAYTYYKFTKREGMGGGDIKLSAMIGAFLGYKAILLVFLLSSILGSLWGLSMICFKKQNLQYALPFGPFLAAGAVVTLFYQDLLFYWLGYI